MPKKPKSAKSCRALEVLKFLAVASAVFGALAILYFGGVSVLSISNGVQYPSGRYAQYGHNISASANSALDLPIQNATVPYFSGSDVPQRFLFNMRADVYGLFAGVLMVLLGVVTLKYAKLRMKMAAN